MVLKHILIVRKRKCSNEFFFQCFNYSTPPLDFSDMDQLEKVGQFPDEILCSEEEVLQLLSNLDVSKANGPDNISARMLKATASSIAPSVTIDCIDFRLRSLYNLCCDSVIQPITKIGLFSNSLETV